MVLKIPEFCPSGCSRPGTLHLRADLLHFYRAVAEGQRCGVVKYLRRRAGQQLQADSICGPHIEIFLYVLEMSALGVPEGQILRRMGPKEERLFWDSKRRLVCSLIPDEGDSRQERAKLALVA